MKITDCLSRQFMEINAISISRNDIRHLQDNDATLNAVRQYAANDRWPNHTTEELHFFKKSRDKIRFGTSGELFIKNDNQLKLVLPQCLTNDVIKTYHDDIGHPGFEKTLNEISSRYIWYRMAADIKEFVRTCHQCQVSKPNLRPKQPPLGHSDTPTHPFEQYAFDLIGPLPVTNNENKYALVGVDLFSKRVHACPLESKLSTIIATEIERILTKNPIMPKSILTDNGLEFAEVTRLCDELGIKHLRSAPYHPQTNGAVERMNQTLKQRLFEFDEENSWDIRLPRVLHAINCSKNATTKMTPFQLENGLSGRNLNDKIDLPRQITENLEELRRLAVERTTLEKELRVLKQGNEDFVPYAVDDLVLAKNHQEKMPRYIGPLKIIKVRGNGLTYELQTLNGTKTHIRAATELKPYYDRPEETQSPSEMPSTTDTQPTSSVDFFDDEDFGINFFPVVSDSEPPDQPTPPQSATPQSVTPPAQPTTPEPSPTPSEEFHSTQDDLTDSDDSDALPIFVEDIDTENEAIVAPTPLRNPDTSNDSEETISDNACTSYSDGGAEDNISSGAEEISALTRNEENRSNAATRSEMQFSITRSDGKISPKPEIKYELKLYQMTSKEVSDIISHLKIPASGTIEEQKKQINRFFQEKYPNHKRTPDGHLVFETTFDPTEKSKLKDFSSLELKVLMKAYNIPPPSVLANKNATYKHCKKFLLKKYPNADLENDDIIFNITRCKTPENPKQIALLKTRKSS